MTTATSSIEIAIIGGGPGGLALAKLLSVHGIRATVLERDPSPTARPQGGSLDLHPDSGQGALAAAGLREKFLELARYNDQDIRVYAPSGELLYEESELGGDRPEIDRAELRQLWLDSLPAGAIEWGRRVESVELDRDGGAIVTCSGGAARRFDLVVGADGAWSRVRPLVTAVAPSYSGMTFVELELDRFDDDHRELAALVPRGKIMALGERKAVIAQRSARGVLRVYVAQVVAESAARELAALTPAAIKAELVRVYAGWSPQLRAFIERAGDRVTVLPICALPIGHRWQHRAGITLIGDAAHVMSPFAGEGVNNALADALALATALASAGHDRDGIDAAVARFEAEMFERIAPSARESAVGADIVMAADAAARMVEVMRGHRPPSA